MRQTILSQIIRQAWDGDTLEVRTRKDKIIAKEPHIAVVTHITTEELLKRLNATETANGFANRFLFVGARRTKLLPLGGNLTDEIVAKAGRKLRSAIQAARRIDRMTWSPEAAEKWAERYVQLAADDPPGILGLASRRRSPGGPPRGHVRTARPQRDDRAGSS